MRSLFAGITTRGRAFFAAGIAVGALGLSLSQRELVSLGGVLVFLPLLAALAAGRARYRIQCVRQIAPARVPAGQAATVTIQLDNVTRLPTGLLLAEDTIPYSLGTRPRFVLDRLQSDRRGKFAIGPLNVRVADAFGLVRLGRQVALPGTLVVTPPITPLPWTAFGGTWLKADGSRASTASAAGEDDVVPRAYRDGDELRRVHWRSTARYGELMVRREEQRWRNRAVLFLDTRLTAHGGRGPASSFEYAVSAAASIGVHLAREEMDTEFVTDAGKAAAPGSFEDVLLDTLAVIRPSRNASLSSGLAQLPADTSGLLIVIAGYLTAGQARELVAARRASGPAMALLLAVSTWAADRPDLAVPGETDEAARVLTAAGWRVATVTADMPLSVAWDVLNRTHLARGGPAAAGVVTGPGSGATAAASAVTGAATAAGSPAAEAGGSAAAPPTGAGANR